jgi:hypothetical protein
MFPSQLYSYAPGNRVFSAIDRLVKSLRVEEVVQVEEAAQVEEAVRVEAVKAVLGGQEVVRAG